MKQKSYETTNFMLLMIGQGLSQFGTSIFFVTLMLFLKALTDSGSLIGLVQMCGFLPVVIFGPIAGILIDKFNRKKILVVTDLVRGILMIIMGLIIWDVLYGKIVFNSDNSDMNLQFIIIFVSIITFFSGTMEAGFIPVIPSLIPDIVQKKNLDTANAWYSSILQISYVGGQSLGGVLFVAIGAPFVFIANGISFIISSIQEGFIKVEYNNDHEVKSVVKNIFKDLKEIFKYVINLKGVRLMLMFFILINFVSPAIMMSLTFFIDKYLGLSEAHYGFILAVFFLGGILGYISYGLFKFKGSNIYILYMLTFLVFSFGMFCCSMFHFSAVIYIGALIMGICIGFMNIILTAN